MSEQAMTAARVATRVWDVRYDDDEAYYVVATYSNKADAERLRDRLREAHLTADRDGCYLDSAWLVHETDVDEIGPDDPLPDGLFDVGALRDDGGHASVAYEHFPLVAQAVE